jgi:nucleoside-diphosphate-sugar epimerase
MAKTAGVKRFIYGGSCSVYGYTENELFDETYPTVSKYPYGISKLQGEYGVLQLADENFSVICFRKGTVCGYSPRMRLDLVLNTMFKTSIETGIINVSNSAICRPILSIKDAVRAYTTAIEFTDNITGIFNIASGNYTVGELAILMQKGLKELMNVDTTIVEHNIKDFRNYKVSFEKAKNILRFEPKYDVSDIIEDLVENYSKFSDFNNKKYNNIQIFKELL